MICLKNTAGLWMDIGFFEDSWGKLVIAECIVENMNWYPFIHAIVFFFSLVVIDLGHLIHTSNFANDITLFKSNKTTNLFIKYTDLHNAGKTPLCISRHHRVNYSTLLPVDSHMTSSSNVYPSCSIVRLSGMHTRHSIRGGRCF